MFVLGAYLSPTLVGEYTRCSVLAMFFHYFFLCQFTWMFVEVKYYVTLVKFSILLP